MKYGRWWRFKNFFRSRSERQRHEAIRKGQKTYWTGDDEDGLWLDVTETEEEFFRGLY